MIDHNPKIRHLHLGAANLVSDKAWRKVFKSQGLKLESLKLSELNDSLDDESVVQLVHQCPNLIRLKLKKCDHLTEASLYSIAKLKKLEHLSLNIANDSSPESLIHLIQSLGPNLRTLSLEHMHEANDTVLSAIHDSCVHLRKLRFMDNTICTDSGFSSLFTNWFNPPIPFLDLSKTRDIDNQNPEGPVDDAIGLASNGFIALMAHTGPKLDRLNISSCRHITFDALSHVFDGKKQYPLLRDLDISFLNKVDDYLVGCIFKCCPSLAKLAVFACFKVKEVRIPRGVAVVGMPNAQDSMVIEGFF